MTTRSQICRDREVVRNHHARWRRSHLPLVVLAACGGIIAGSSPVLNPTRAATPEDAATTARTLQQPHAAAISRLAMSPRVAIEANDDRLVRTLAGIVAKRYRIANNATRDLVQIAYHEARRNRLDPLLVLAVIAVESRFNPIAESDGGALGLMQIVPKYHVATVDDNTRASMLDPQRNIGLGARVLKQYVKVAGTEIAGLQMYNGTADDLTNAYANRVMAEKQRLADSLRRAGEGA